MFKIVKVRGESMTPALSSGDYIILTKARALRPGFVVLADHPKYGLITKRVKTVEKDSVLLEGDGPESTSSEAMGLIPKDKIIGRARLAIRPDGLKRL